MRIVLFGAGSAQFGYGMLGDIFKNPTLQGAEIVLVDIREEALKKVHDTALDYIEHNKLTHRVTATLDADEALRGAEFVIISIEVGNRFELWEQDWYIPLQYGVKQVYGENGGAGGMFHALRIIPPILEICERVERLCPDAFVFCYSNPMTAITAAVKRRYPQMNFIGVCHEIASLKRYVPDILQTPMENLHLRAAGLNHFSVVIEARYRDTGNDAYGDLMEKSREFFSREPGFSEILEYTRKTGEIPRTEGSTQRILTAVKEVRQWSDRLLFRKCMDWFGLLPITSDSHLGEYIPWAYELADQRGIGDFYTFYKYALSRVVPEIGDDVHERVSFMIEGIITDSGYEEPAVNILNDNLIPDLPKWIPVEVPARVHAGGFTGIAFPEYPKAFGALLRNYTGTYDLTADAVLNKSKECALQALLVNPVIRDASRIEQLLDAMISLQERWLGYLR